MNWERTEDIEGKFTQSSKALRQEKWEVTHSQLPGNVPAGHRDGAARLSKGKPPPGFSQTAMRVPKAGQQQFGVGMTSVRARQSSGLNPCFTRHAGSKESVWDQAKGILFPSIFSVLFSRLSSQSKSSS